MKTKMSSAAIPSTMNMTKLWSDPKYKHRRIPVYINDVTGKLNRIIAIPMKAKYILPRW